MTALPKLTLLEKDVLGGIYASNYADTANPNVWSWSIEPLVCTMEQRAGVVSSLNKKGIVTSEGSGDEASMWVSDTGAAIARELGIYSDETYYSEAGHLAAVATPKQMKKAVNSVLAQVARQEKAGTSGNIEVKVGRGIEQVMQLDDAGVRKEWGLTIVKQTKETLTLSASRGNIINFRNACADRISSQYDQPLWYMSSAKATVAKIDAALKASK